MKAYNYKIFIIVVLMVFSTLGVNVYAADNNPNRYTCNITATPDKNTVKPGEDITYDIKVSNINAGNGLKMIEYYVGNYDSNIFECKVRNYNEDKWTIINNEGYVTISSNDSGAWKTDETIAKIIYTPKSGTTDNTYQPKITNIKMTTDDDSIFTLNDLTLNIKVESEQTKEKNYSCNVIFTPDKTSVKPGESITYDLKLSNINAGNGIKILEFYIGNYDTSKFECKVNNYNEDKWSIRNTEGYISISSNNSEAWKSDEILAKIIYTPKSGVTANTYQVPITKIKATTEDSSIITLKDTSLNIRVDDEQVIDKNYSCNISFTPDKTTVKPGENLSYDLKVLDINAGNGIKKVEFYLGNYDPNIFDCSVSNYDENKWNITASEGNIVITSKTSQPWTSDEILAKIIYTPKNGVTANTYQTQITNISATTADNTKLTMKDVNLGIKVENSNQAISEDIPGDNKSEEASKGNESSVINTDNTNSSKNNKAMVLPNTGKVGIIAIIVSSITLVLASTGFYFKYKKINI